MQSCLRDSAGEVLAGGDRDIGEVQIEGEDNPTLFACQTEDIGVGQSSQAEFLAMCCVVSSHAQFPNNRRANAHIRQKFHAAAYEAMTSSRVNAAA